MNFILLPPNLKISKEINNIKTSVILSEIDKLSRNSGSSSAMNSKFVKKTSLIPKAFGVKDIKTLNEETKV